MQLRTRTIGGWLAAAGLAGILAAAAAVPAFAAGAIQSVQMNFDSSYETGVIKEPQISVGNGNVSIDSVSWSKKTESWKPGTKVTATILLSCDGGEEFSSSYGKRKLRISGAELGSAKKSGDRLKVTAYYYPVVQLAAPEEAGWSDLERTKASWSEVEYATGYQLKLYRDGTYLRTIDSVGTSKDLSEYFTEEGSYSYEVRAVGKDRDDAKYRKSSEYTASTDSAVENLGDTDGDWKLYAQGKKYQRNDGTYVTDQWYKILGKWYLFNAEGYAATGWQEKDGEWYYMDGEGAMAAGWLEIGGAWYYFGEDGAMATGWCQTAPNKWYYFNEDGTMASNSIIDGRTLDESGLWVQ